MYSRAAALPMAVVLGALVSGGSQQSSRRAADERLQTISRIDRFIAAGGRGPYPDME